ncbi:MAG: polysaccharide deacetylase family protein [bacterium]|nr:polysaccharide deacetylase family protein [bacterium]
MSEAEAKAKLEQYWQHAKEEVYKSVPELLAQDQTELERGLKYKKFMHGDRTKKWIALTFDDGPHPEYTPRLLDILQRYNVRATFFVVGKMAEKHPDLLRQQAQAGHSIGNHTYHHVNLTRIPPADVAAEIKACGEVIQSITGKAPHLFRPPGGDYDRNVAEVAEALGYWIVLWTDDPGDYAKPPEKELRQKLFSRISNGGIILLHDGVEETIDLLPDLIEYLQSQGYKLVTIDEMLPADSR